ncbi:MAG: hydroxyethylthiazole kinase [Cellulosilyticaceae bacterium]
MFQAILTNVEKRRPLVHNITNNVTINDCANIILACGGSPIMASDAREVEEITSICQSLVMNMGIVGSATESMILAGKKSNELGHPVILDPVAAGASKLRRQVVSQLVEEVKCSVIRGNISEIKTIYGDEGTCQGVDASEDDRINEANIDHVIHMAKSLSHRTDAVIAISGAIDVVADDKTAYVIYNGHPIMERITGTGCMLSALVGAFCGANEERILEATAAAVAAMGVCGELAYDKMVSTDGGTLSFRTYLIDYMSRINGELLNGGIRIEIK